MACTIAQQIVAASQESDYEARNLLTQHDATIAGHPVRVQYRGLIADARLWHLADGSYVARSTYGDWYVIDPFRAQLGGADGIVYLLDDLESREDGQQVL